MIISYRLIHSLAILFGEPSILYTNWMKNSQVSAEKTKNSTGNPVLFLRIILF